MTSLTDWRNLQALEPKADVLDGLTEISMTTEYFCFPVRLFWGPRACVYEATVRFRPRELR